MQRYLLYIVGAAVLLAILATNTFFVVRQDQQAIVRRFAAFQREINPPTREEPGLYIKTPFAEDVVYYDRRNIGLTLAGQDILASDQERLVVDAMVRWRIADPRRFYQSAQTEAEGAQRLATFAEAALRRALGGATSNDIISGRRAELMQAIEADMNGATATELGVQVIDVRIRQADFPTETRDLIYTRMASERAEVAGRIRAEASRQAVIIRATAREQSERLRGEGDAERARVFARAYGRDPEFAAFYRSMRAYEAALGEGTPIVVPPDSDFFRYMQSRRGGR